MNFGYDLDFGYVIQHVPDFLHGLAWTLVLLVVTASIGTVLGIACGAIRAYRLGGPLAIVSLVQSDVVTRCLQVLQSQMHVPDRCAAGFPAWPLTCSSVCGPNCCWTLLQPPPASFSR